MSSFRNDVSIIVLGVMALSLSSCSSNSYHNESYDYSSNYASPNAPPSGNVANFQSYESRLPQSINTKGRKVILVDPNVHAWGAYDSNGNLVRAGLATAGGNWCSDIGRSCRTGAGSFTIKSLGGPECISHLYPRPHGGAPMPYCMFFNGGQGLHGSHPVSVVEANVSHGCVRMQIPDAEWVRYNFATVGTKVIVRPY